MAPKLKSPPEIGSRLLKLRKAGGLSLEDVAAKAQISKSMLSQVERGLANPTFATLWALTQALGVDISDLIGSQVIESDSKIAVIEAHNIPLIRSSDGACVLKILSPPETTGRCEWYDLEISVGGALRSQPHARGAMEHLSILDGQAEIHSGPHQASGVKGDTLRYNADSAHTIINTGKRPLKALLMVMSEHS